MNSGSAFDAFVADLCIHVEQLRADKCRMGSRKLAQFRSFRYGEDDAFYPIDARSLPWRKHRVAVSRAELIAAGYEEYCRGWKWRPDADPWRHVYWGGEVPLWYWGVDSAEHETRLPRARLLEHLAAVLKCRRELSDSGRAEVPSGGRAQSSMQADPLLR